ncbi:MAG: hypothetical protein ACYTDU_01295 [Planctomycetota bacterium]
MLRDLVGGDLSDQLEHHLDLLARLLDAGRRELVPAVGAALEGGEQFIPGDRTDAAPQVGVVGVVAGHVDGAS